MNRIMVSILLVSAVFSQQEPEAEPEKPDIAINFVGADDELLLNWSVNTYVGYPIYNADYFNSRYKSNPIYGFSIGTPIGFKAGLAYATIDFEVINYGYELIERREGAGNYDGVALLVGFNSGLFINDLSLSLTAAAGKYHNGLNGLISGINVDLPYWGDFEVRGTMRFNAVPVIRDNKDGLSGWVDLGVSIGYEF